MKKLIGLVGIVALWILPGCLDTTEETTINDDGSGVYINTADMGKILSMLGAMGGDNEKMKEIEKLKKDTTIMLKDMKDSTVKLSEAELKLLEKGTARIIMNYEEEKFSVSFSIPFSKPEEILLINNALQTSKGDMMSNQLKNVFPGEGANDEEDIQVMGNKAENNSDLNSYFDLTYEKAKLKKKVNKEKYAKAKDDKSLKSLQELSQMGMTVSFKTIINLPKPAKKAEGKGIKLSEDKKTITIETTLDDFFDDISKFEYEVEY